MVSFERLKYIREDNDITQAQMAEILNVKRSTYSLWELGINIIPLKYLSLFADYFNYSLDYILSLTNNRQNILLKKGLDNKKIGNNIRYYRIKMKLSQKELADMLNVTQACIVRYEKGLVSLPISNAYELSKIFNISINKLCGKEKNKELINL
ncbi:MAG: helix-turn-helix transcriptional regulator [Bacilli bacterium]|nr:helix-turn-helix transcriptional regulator [Bacilli bacterium]